MNKTFLIVFLLIINVASFRASDEVKNLLKLLDHKIENKQLYITKKEARIDSLTSLRKEIKSRQEEYNINNMIYEEYSTYRFDSAYTYLLKNKDIAESVGKQIYKDETNLKTSVLLSTTGMFDESKECLNQIDRHMIDPSLLSSYYIAHEMFYYGKRSFINDNAFALQYIQNENTYIDSVSLTLQEGTLMHEYYIGYKLMKNGELEEAKTKLLRLLDILPTNSRMYAMISSNIASIYYKSENYDGYEKYLALAAISDIECALKENMAMQKLAVFLYEKRSEDLDKAYFYIQTSMKDAQFYNNKLRILQIANALPTIVSAYQEKSNVENKNQRIALIIISILLVFMIVSTKYIHSQIKVLNRHRKQLNGLNTELGDLNEKLQYANKNKEEYVGMFMDLCSSYLNKMSKNREIVIHKILTKQITELYAINSSKKVIEMEISDFFDNFDTAFLNLYPSFITDFNKLLSENKQLTLKENSLLNTELRIFALIRLGITDSSQIASFLRYAPQTIYNYRTKVKNNAKGNRDDFENKIMEIGL